MAEHGGAQVIDHDPPRHPQGREGLAMRGQEVLHRLAQGECDVHLPAIGQHHDEKGQPPAAVANGDRAPVAPLCRVQDYAESLILPAVLTVYISALANPASRRRGIVLARSQCLEKGEQGVLRLVDGR